MRQTKRLTSEAEVKQEVETRRNKEVSELAWQMCWDNGYIERILDADEDSQEYELQTLLNAVDAMEARVKNRPSRGRSADDVIADLDDTTDDDRAEYDKAIRKAVHRYIAQQVSRREDVVQFREKFRQCLPPGWTITPQEVLRVLGKPIAVFLTFEDVQHMDGVTLFTELSVEPDRDQERLRYRVQPFIPLPNFHSQWLAARQTVSFQSWDCLAINLGPVRPIEGIHKHPWMSVTDPSGQNRMSNRLVEEATQTAGMPILTFAPTIAGQAILLAEKLAQDYTLDILQALILLLTGTPQAPPLVRGMYSTRKVYDDRTPGIDYFAHGPITIQVEPWVSVATVSRAYRALQQDAYAGKDNHPPTLENIDLFRFVSERLDTLKGRSPWEELSRQWAESCGHKLKGSHIQTIYGRVRAKLFPNHYWAAILSDPASPRWKEETRRRIRLWEEQTRRRMQRKEEENNASE